jgi:16S rRNA (cytosine1402-N4)-methyltransferase
MAHVPVLTEEVLKLLNPQPGDNFVDATLGDGGHSAALLERTAPDGKVLAFDLDAEAVKAGSENLKKFGERVILVNGNYATLAETAEREQFGPIAGVLADFGFSSPQIEDRLRGFSFQRDEPLDMRYDAVGNPLTAAEIVNTWPKDELVRILAEYGEERMANRIASAIIAARRSKSIISTAALVYVIVTAVPPNYEHGRIHPATRTFQALRIAVNDELDSIGKVLPQALAVVKSGGVLAFISFHSLEDRLVKEFFKKAESDQKIKILTKKPIIAGDREIAGNSRSRSAKLRAAAKL